MRPIITLHNPQHAETLAAYLKNQHIDCHLETCKNSNWGDPHYSDVDCTIWVYNEDLLSRAQQIAEKFLQAPEGAQYKNSQTKGNSMPSVKESPSLSSPAAAKYRPTANVAMRQSDRSMGSLTFYFLIACCALFLWTQFSILTQGESAFSASSMPSAYPPVKKALLYDYPHAFEILDKLIATYGLEDLQKAQEIPPGALHLLAEYKATPYWKGFYDVAVQHAQFPELPWNFVAPMFEKIKEGEIWRLLSPAFLHADFFHLLFNMIWLAVIGRQLEARMGTWRYLLFVVAAGIVSNTAQYLMGGSNFLGFSGILCAMLSFIWVRQRRSAWEGYFLQPSTMGFMLVFLGAMLIFQVVSFYSEIAFDRAIAPPIANTAHMAGLAVGFLFGHMNFFSSRT